MEGFKTTAPVMQTLGVDWMPEPFEDTSTEGVKYVGWAPLGVGESDAGWRIMKETTADGVTKREYANGSMDFAFAWASRKSYSYGR